MPETTKGDDMKTSRMVRIRWNKGKCKWCFDLLTQEAAKKLLEKDKVVFEVWEILEKQA
jgi:hypothetical protein